MTDSELRKVFRKGFSNPQHLDDLLKRTDLSKDRQDHVRTNLAQGYLSRQIQSEALQRFISQLSKAKTTDQFDQVLAELRHANHLIDSGVVAQNSPLFTSAKKGRIYRLGSTTVKIHPVHEADTLYLGTDGLIHLHEVKNTAKALRQKLKKHPKQLQNMLEWREEQPEQRKIRIVISREGGWTQVFAPLNKGESALKTLINNDISLTIGTHHLTLAMMERLWYGTIRKAQELSMFPPRKKFFDMIPTLLAAKEVGISWQ